MPKRHSLVSSSHPPRMAPSSQPTDHSSFPPLSTNPRDMTVVPEDSISRVEPQHRVNEKLVGEAVRGNSEDRGRKREHWRDRRGTTKSHSQERERYASRESWRGQRLQEPPRPRHHSPLRSSSSDSGSSRTSVRSRPSSSSSGTSTPRRGAYSIRTMSPPIFSPRPTIVQPPYRISSPAMMPLVRPPMAATHSYMPQSFSPPPLTPIQSQMMPMHLGIQMGHHPWSAMSNFSSVALSPPPTAFTQSWSPHLGPPSQVALGARPYPGSMRPSFGNMSIGGNDNAWMNASRRGSTPQLLNTAMVSGQPRGMSGGMSGNMRPPRPVRAASAPVTGHVDGSPILR